MNGVTNVTAAAPLQNESRPYVTPVNYSHMISPQVGPDQEADVKDLLILALGKVANPVMPRMIGGTFTFFNVNAARAFQHLLELQGIPYDMTFLPEVAGEPVGA